MGSGAFTAGKTIGGQLDVNFRKAPSLMRVKTRHPDRVAEETLVDFLGMRFPGDVRIQDLIDLAMTLVESKTSPSLQRELPTLLEDLFEDMQRIEGKRHTIEKETLLFWVMEKQDMRVRMTNLSVPIFQAVLAEEVLRSLPPRLASIDRSKELLTAFASADRNADGYLDTNEFLEALCKLGVATMEDVCNGGLSLFHKVDKDGDGLIEVEDLHTWLEELGTSNKTTEGIDDMEILRKRILTELEEARTEFPCCICTCVEPLSRMARLHVTTDSCESRACVDCVVHSVESIGFMRCPTCAEIVDVVNLANILSADEQVLYLDRTFEEYKRAHLDRIFHCKTPDCANFVLIAKEKSKKKRRDFWSRKNRWCCRLCGMKWCVVCERPSTGVHYQKSCEEVDELEIASIREQHEQTDAALLLTCTCKTSLLKFGGCKYLTCSNARCKKNWCWVCRKGPSDTVHFHHDCLIPGYYGKHSKSANGEDHPINALEEIVEEVCKCQLREMGKSVEEVQGVMARFMEDRKINVASMREYFKEDDEVFQCLPEPGNEVNRTDDGSSDGHGMNEREAQLVAMGFGLIEVRTILAAYLREPWTVEQAVDVLTRR